MKTIEKLAQFIEEDIQSYSDEGDIEEAIYSKKFLNSLLNAKSGAEVVSVFINMAVDLESFVDMVEDLNIPREERKILVGEAMIRKGRWST